MHDLAIIGSGFGGSLLAAIARKLGRSVILLERGTHPRFVIGESSTPMADLLWLELTARYDLPELVPFAKWGTWRRTHPEVACGLKRGFSFFHHQPGSPFSAASDHSDHLLVAASPTEEIADTHWYRPDFDHFLVRHAIGLGADYHDHCEVIDVRPGAHHVDLTAREHGNEIAFRARFVVDAGNVRGPLARSLGLTAQPLPHLPDTQALFTHFTDVGRMADLTPPTPGLPFPVDDAALHHVFDGGWIWVLRFVNGITSAGVAATDAVANRLRFHDGAAAWYRLLAELPTVARQFRDARPTRPFVHAPRLGFRTGPAAGPNWALLPSAAGFIDPLLSSGFTLTLLGIERLADALDKHWTHPDGLADALRHHTTQTEGELLAVEEFVATLYARMGDFAAFTEIARLYFTAVIWCETARRLVRPDLAGGHLMHAHPVFGPAARRCCEAARQGTGAAQLRGLVDAAIAPFDLAGLGDARRRPWYPVLATDLLRSRGLLGVDATAINSLLRVMGSDLYC